MFEVRIHGRGGQGVVTAAGLLSEAAFEEGCHAQAFPSFGSERTGAPVVAFCRISDGPIRTREPVMHPDALVVQDPTLVHQVDLFAGLASDGYVLINSSRTLEELGLESLIEGRPPGRAVTMPASEIAREHAGRPVPNAVLLGASRPSPESSTSTRSWARSAKFPAEIAEGNVAGATAAFALLGGTPREAVDARAD
ncbi:MAG: 2-oxoacid:acceptor oxidoreductase family protein [Thermoleophilia bacterium]